jgi:hypothetical protein
MQPLELLSQSTTPDGSDLKLTRRTIGYIQFLGKTSPIMEVFWTRVLLDCRLIYLNGSAVLEWSSGELR